MATVGVKGLTFSEALPLSVSLSMWQDCVRWAVSVERDDWSLDWPLPYLVTIQHNTTLAVDHNSCLSVIKCISRRDAVVC